VGLRGRRSARRCRPCAWPAFEVSDPLGPPPARKRAKDRHSRGLVPYDTSQLGGSGSPGGSTPRHLPSSGFDHPLDGLLPAQPGDGPSTAAASMGFALQGLAPPGWRRPSRGLASPVVSPVGPKAGRSRLQRLSPTGKGNDAPPPEGADRRTLPSWVFAPPRHSPPPRWNRLPGSGPSCPSAGSTPYGLLPDGAPGVTWRKRLVSLETAGLPGVLHLSDRRATWASSRSGLMTSPRSTGSSQ